jgi:hypothetical protein
VKDSKFEIDKFVNSDVELDVSISPKDETDWLSLDESTSRAKFARHLEDGRVYQIDLYNLDVIIAFGYRVNSKKGTVKNVVCFHSGFELSF